MGTIFNGLELVWIAAIGGAFIVTLIVALIFYQQEGRARWYFSLFLFALAAEEAIAVFMAIETPGGVRTWFVIPRVFGRSLVCFTGIGVILYQLGLLNGKKKQGAK